MFILSFQFSGQRPYKVEPADRVECDQELHDQICVRQNAQGLTAAGKTRWRFYCFFCSGWWIPGGGVGGVWEGCGESGLLYRIREVGIELCCAFSVGQMLLQAKPMHVYMYMTWVPRQDGGKWYPFETNQERRARITRCDWLRLTDLLGFMWRHVGHATRYWSWDWLPFTVLEVWRLYVDLCLTGNVIFLLSNRKPRWSKLLTNKRRYVSLLVVFFSWSRSVYTANA